MRRRREPSSEHQRSLPLARGLAATGLVPLFLIGLVAGCRSVESSVWNLRETHDPDGSPSRFGAVMSPFEYRVRRGLASLNTGDFEFGEKNREEIEDPHRVTLKSLIGLAAVEPEDALTAGLQVEVFTWLAVDDRSPLARERAVIGLTKAGLRLGVDQPRQLEPGTEVASPAEVAGALEAVVESAGAVVFGPDGTADREALARGAESVRALELDRDGARRALATVNVLLQGGASERRGLEPLMELHRELQGTCVELALGEALLDLHPRVRAAAIEGICRVSDNRTPGLVIQALRVESSSLVLVRILHWIAEEGLPLPGQDLELDEREDYLELWLENLVEKSQLGHGEVSVAACKALGRVSEAGFQSLRWEDWAAWWDERQKPGAPDGR